MDLTWIVKEGEEAWMNFMGFGQRNQKNGAAVKQGEGQGWLKRVGAQLWIVNFEKLTDIQWVMSVGS